MDFYRVAVRKTKDEEPALYPDWIIGRSSDLMVQGRSFYAIWDEEKGLWSTDEYDVQRLVDAELKEYSNEYAKSSDGTFTVRYLRSSTNKSWSTFRQFIGNISDNAKQLDSSLTFADTVVKKEDYASKRLPYALAEGDYPAWDELVGTLYSVEERAKIEWAIGAIVSGDSKKIQKFLVFYGSPGTGKGTVLDIVLKLFQGYTTTFEAAALASNNASFSTEPFKNNPLVAVQHDGDLSRIQDNTKLNSIVSHEYMTMNEKYKPSYSDRVNAFCLMGTNQPVKISDAKSGMLRRLIDVHPTGVRIPSNHYFTLIQQIDFELGAIAHHCLEVYREMGKNYYNGYRPVEMMFQTDIFFNFIEANFDVFKAQDSVSLKQAYALYKEFCNDTGIEKVLPQYKVREELRNYFDEFKDRHGDQRSVYVGFNANQFKAPAKEAAVFSLVMEETVSLLDEVLADQPAQSWREDEDGQIVPRYKWKNVRTKLSSLDTSDLHFVRVPDSHIVIDFDLEDLDGKKSLERNLEAASVWPSTYAELSKSGSGVHLHYDYESDVTQLSNVYSAGIEVKTLLGDASLRRKLTKCNNVPIATLKSGILPLKEKEVLSETTMKSEKSLRDLIGRNLNKEIHPGTKPSVDFIKKILDDAYESGMTYDVTDMRTKIMAFANNSSNQPLVSLKTVAQMKFSGKDAPVDQPVSPEEAMERELFNLQGNPLVKTDARLVFFDVEVYPNLFVICWKYDGGTMVRMINPTAQEVEKLFKLKLVGYNCRRYDNHILYGAYLGLDNAGLYKLSQDIIIHKTGFYAEAYNLSYADIYDFSILKQTLKKFMIDLKITKQELSIPWDQPVPPELIPKVVEYCCNDVNGTAVTFHSREGDFIARQILAELSGLTVNDTTARHTAKIIFGNERQPQKNFIYTDLSKEFPGYEFDRGKSIYRGEDPSEGGYVHAEPGIYENVAVLDIASMHPTTIEQLNLFGPYTSAFSALKEARLAIKHRDFDSARNLLAGRLAPFLRDPAQAAALSDALKIVINSVYGLSSAKFDNPFRDYRNMDNIVAKRGALFMIDLKHACQEKGLQVVHIKTDSIKIPNATPEDIEEITNFGAKYGYTFEHESTYEKFCLVDKAQYIAREDGQWMPTGAQFAHPYVFKTLFSQEVIEWDDFCETKQITKGAMYMDSELDRVGKPTPESMKFIGRIGRFIPVIEGVQGAGLLYRVVDDLPYAVTGTKGYLWMEVETALALGVDITMIDMSYFERLASEAVATINKFGDFKEFVS